jgi:hypothetical protein
MVETSRLSLLEELFRRFSLPTLTSGLVTQSRGNEPKLIETLEKYISWPLLAKYFSCRFMVKPRFNCSICFTSLSLPVVELRCERY